MDTKKTRTGMRVSEHLKTTMLKAFGKQRDFAEQFERSFPVIQEKLISLANIQAGQSMSIENLAGLVKDLQIIVSTFRALADRGEEAVLEANIATMQLKEFEKTPVEVVEDLGDPATILMNSDIWMQSSVEFVLQTMELALPNVREEAVKQLSPDAFNAWLDVFSTKRDAA